MPLLARVKRANKTPTVNHPIVVSLPKEAIPANVRIEAKALVFCIFGIWTDATLTALDERSIAILIRTICTTYLLIIALRIVRADIRAGNLLLSSLLIVPIVVSGLITESATSIEFVWLITFLSLFVIVATASPPPSYAFRINSFDWLRYGVVVFYLYGVACNWVFHSETSSSLPNPNVVAALVGAQIVLIATLSRTLGQKPGKLMALIGYIALVTTFSRTAVLWVLLHAWVSTAGSKQWLATRLVRGALLAFLLLSLGLLALSVLYPTATSAAVVVGLESSTVNWRLKGETESDIRRISYYPSVVFDNLSRDQYLFGEGFGKKSYLSGLQPGEDLHNGYLNILNGGGLVSLVSVLGIIFIVPILWRTFHRRGRWQPLLPVYAIYASTVYFPGPILGLQGFAALLLLLLVLWKISPKVFVLLPDDLTDDLKQSSFSETSAPAIRQMSTYAPHKPAS
jgi:hypothetical protein